MRLMFQCDLCFLLHTSADDCGKCERRCAAQLKQAEALDACHKEAWTPCACPKCSIDHTAELDTLKG